MKVVELDDKSVAQVVSAIGAPLKEADRRRCDRAGRGQKTRSRLRSSPDLLALRKQEAEDERHVTVRQANLIHRHFIEEVYEPYWQGDDFDLDGVWLHYGGILPRMNAGDPRTPADADSPLEWQLMCGRKAVFTIAVTTVKTKFTLAKFTIEGKEFYANVPWVADGRSVYDDLPELGESAQRAVIRTELPLRDPGDCLPHYPTCGDLTGVLGQVAVGQASPGWVGRP